MERVPVAGGDLEVEVRGTGEPVLLIHGALIRDAFAPLLAEGVLTTHYRVISYHLRGYGGSTTPPAAFSVADQAADAAAVLCHLGMEPAHIVGHSSGGVIALQLALDAPSVVHSLSLLEPALVSLVPSGAVFGAALAPVLAAYQAGDTVAGVDGFLSGVFERPDYRTTVDQVLGPAWFDQAVAEADTFFQVEFPAVGAWSFDEAAARRISQPVLSVLGADSGPMLVEIDALVRQWLPQAEAYVLPRATHGLQMQNPHDLAAALVEYFARHPLAVPA